jgi:hypothetical protein
VGPIGMEQGRGVVGSFLKMFHTEATSMTNKGK